MKKQSGFSFLGGILILVALGIIGFTGWFVWNSNKNTNSSLDKATSTTEAKIPKKTAASTPEYLNIKEWGVKIPLTDGISTAVYSSDQYSTGTVAATSGSAKLALLSLGADCDDSTKAPLGRYVEFLEEDVAKEDVDQVPEGTTSLHDLAKTAVKVPGSDGGYGAYYIAYVPPVSSCTEDTATFNAATTAFQQAVKNLK